MAEHDFETVASETVYVGKIFALRADEVRMPGGNTARREVVEHYGAVAVLALDDDNNVVLVYQYRHPARPAAVGAARRPAGPRWRTAAHHRRARTQGRGRVWRPRDWRVLVDLDSAPGFSDESVRVYLATGLTDVGRPEAHDEEADLTLRWFPLDEAVRMVLTGEIANSIAVGGILAAHTVTDVTSLRPVEAPWIDRPTAFARRKGH